MSSEPTTSGGTEQPQEPGGRNENQSFVLIPYAGALERVGEGSREIGDRPIMRAFAPAHRGAARVSTVLAKRTAGPVGVDVPVTQSTLRVLDRFDEL